MYANGSEAKYIEEAGWVQVATSQEIGIQTGSYFLSTDKYISENTDTLAKFLQAVDEVRSISTIIWMNLQNTWQTNLV